MLDLKRKFDADVQRLVENGGEVVEVPRRDRDCTGSEQSAAWARAVAQRAKERRDLTMEFRTQSMWENSNTAIREESRIVQ